MTTLEKYNYTGCNSCPLSKLEPRGVCVREYRILIKVKITKAVFWEDWCVQRLVFSKGDVVEGKAVVKDGILYCFTAESTMSPGVSDYLDLGSIEVLEGS